MRASAVDRPPRADPAAPGPLPSPPLVSRAAAAGAGRPAPAVLALARELYDAARDGGGAVLAPFRLGRPR